MAAKVKVMRKDTVLYEGNILNIPIKENAIVKKCIAVFGDDDPCIIHQSFAIKEYTNELLTSLKKAPNHRVENEALKERFSFIDYPNLEEIHIELLE